MSFGWQCQELSSGKFPGMKVVIFMLLLAQVSWAHGPNTGPERDSKVMVNPIREKRMADVNVYGSSLRWVPFGGSIPNGAVSFWNSYANRREYPCATSNCHIGFYTTGRGPFCSYPYADHEMQTSSFSLLVNPGERETLVWKAGSWGSIPNRAVNACGGDNIYVGKNRYGLGKVDRRNAAFFIGIDGSEYFYKWYDVLTFA
ncbi:natterin-3-like isoform X2 [Varanus komodoensis]|uniref:natterin-3-like isoform X2 n=1 Tax=Varanus komodoensis TaxID=61221 RepID=UPI001CF7EBFE|nr:natterin-3-like isoform X2 [Varanus komodoensis]